jgi:orotate phosphoribosyltransferase
VTKQEASELLKRPIEYNLEFLAAAAYKLKDQKHAEAARNVLAERQRRYEALFVYFGIPTDGLNAQSELIMRMGEKLFPGGFKFLRRGEKHRGRDTRWTTSALVDLWHVIESFRATGLSVEDAACIVQDHELVPADADVASIVQRYYEANRLVRRQQTGNATWFEEFDIMAYHFSVPQTLDLE